MTALTNLGRELARIGQAAALATTIDDKARRADLVTTFDTCIEASRVTGWHFTAEDVRADLEPETVAWLNQHHPNALPALFGAASRTERIRCVGRRTSPRPTRHSNEIRVWTARKDTRNANTH